MPNRVFTTILTTLLWLAGPVDAACTGDCSGDGLVTVDEIIQGVNIALGISLLTRCARFDVDASGSVTVDEVVGAVNDALRGCPLFTPGAYGAAFDVDGQPADVQFTAAENGAIEGELNLPSTPSSPSAGQGAAAFPITGSVDFNSGRFSITGSIPGPPPIEIDISGTLPSAGGSGSISMRIGSQTYSGTFGPPSPTPTATPPAGTQHTVKVGQTNLPFDPEVIEINPGDTVVWMWVGGPHSVRSAPAGSPGQPNCTPDGRFDSGLKSTGSFSYTFAAPGSYEYHCGVGSHCQSFESGIVIVRGTPTATPTSTATQTPPPPSTATATATVEVVDGVSRTILGIFSGDYITQFGTKLEARLQIEQTGVAQVQATDLSSIGSVLGVSGQVTMIADTPTRISYVKPDPIDMRSLTLELVGPGHLTGTHMVGSPGMQFTSMLDLMREP